jgi:hypothetical protein
MNLLMKYKSRLQRSSPGEDELKVIIPKTKLSSLAVMPGEHYTTLWRNPYPQGTPQARAESLRIIEAARRGEPI